MPRKAPLRQSRARTRKSAVMDTAPALSATFSELPLDDKRELILAHAQARLRHPKGNVIGMYLGVAICTVLVIVGWIIALPRTLASQDWSEPDEAIEAVARNGAALGHSFSGDGERIDRAEASAKELIESIKQQNQAAHR